MVTTFLRDHLQQLAALAVAIWFHWRTRPGRFLWRKLWKPLLARLGRQVVPEKLAWRDGRPHPNRRQGERTFSPALKAELLKRDGPQCQCLGGCRSLFHKYDGQCAAVHGTPGVALEGDHYYVAWSRGGKTNKANGKMLCGPCNKSKSDRPPAHDRFDREAAA